MAGGKKSMMEYIESIKESLPYKTRKQFIDMNNASDRIVRAIENCNELIIVDGVLWNSCDKKSETPFILAGLWGGAVEAIAYAEDPLILVAVSEVIGKRYTYQYYYFEHGLGLLN